MCKLPCWLQSNDEDGSSFDAAAPLPFSDEQEASVVNMDAAASASKPQHDDMTAVSAESSAAGLAVDDVNVDVLGDSPIHHEACNHYAAAAWPILPCLKLAVAQQLPLRVTQHSQLLLH